MLWAQQWSVSLQNYKQNSLEHLCFDLNCLSSLECLLFRLKLYGVCLLFALNCVSLCQVLETATQKETGEGVQSEVSFKVTSDITAFCNASNDFGADAVAFNIKAREFLLPFVFPRLALCLARLCSPSPPVPISPPSPSVPALLLHVTFLICLVMIRIFVVVVVVFVDPVKLHSS